MRPTEVLMNEHRVIEQVLSCLDALVQRCDRDGRLEAEPARQAIDFFRGFADRCHHGKEEDQLFPMLAERGFPTDAGPVAVMRMEHAQGRQRIAGMEAAIDAAAAGDPDAVRTWSAHARGYVALLREHIQKEDHCLFPMADDALGPADQETLSAAFDRVEHDDMGPGTHERYLRLADALAERLGVPRATVHGACSCGGH